jgi:TPR repeat protein
MTDEEIKSRIRVGSPLTRFTRHEDRDKVYACLTHAGETASGEAQYDLYRMGLAVGPGFNTLYWLKRAAYSGLPVAQADLADQLMLGLSSIRREMPSAIREEVSHERYHYWLKRAADSGYMRAQFQLALLYLGSEGKLWSKFEDTKSAMSILWTLANSTTRTAEEHLIKNRAANELGGLYFKGEKVPRDYVTALKWYSAVDEKYIYACRLPLAGTWFSLMEIYGKGLGVESSPEKVSYYKRIWKGGCD